MGAQIAIGSLFSTEYFITSATTTMQPEINNNDLRDPTLGSGRAADTSKSAFNSITSSTLQRVRQITIYCADDYVLSMSKSVNGSDDRLGYCKKAQTGTKSPSNVSIVRIAKRSGHSEYLSSTQLIDDMKRSLYLNLLHLESFPAPHPTAKSSKMRQRRPQCHSYGVIRVAEHPHQVYYFRNGKVRRGGRTMALVAKLPLTATLAVIAFTAIFQAELDAQESEQVTSSAHLICGRFTAAKVRHLRNPRIVLLREGSSPPAKIR